MANYSNERRQYHIERVRALLVRNASLGITDIQKALETSDTSPLRLDNHYISKIIKKIKAEKAQRLNHATVDQYLTSFGDEVEALKKQLWVIIQSPDAWYKDKIAAIRELRNSSKDLFDKMFDAGVFNRKLGELKVNDLTAEQEEILKKALEYGTNRANRAGAVGDTEQPSATEEAGTK